MLDNNQVEASESSTYLEIKTLNYYSFNSYTALLDILTILFFYFQKLKQQQNKSKKAVLQWMPKLQIWSILC